MLDPSEQANLLQLLKQLQVERGMAMVFISHDLAVVLRVADRVVVLDRGRIVEEGTSRRLLVSPDHPVTRSLLRAAGRDLLFGADRPASSAPRPELGGAPTPVPVGRQTGALCDTHITLF